MTLWDTGPLLAALNKEDDFHLVCRELVRRTPKPLEVPSPVLVEVAYMLHRDLGPHAEARFLRQIDGSYLAPVHPETADYARAGELADRYASFPLGMVDACVMAMAERRRERVVATLDRRHFHAVRLKHCDALELRP